MSYHWADNVHTTAFSPRDYQVELLASAIEKNIMICVGHKSSKEFIALKLIQELAFELRYPENSKTTIYLTRKSGDSAFNLLYHLTDLKVVHAKREPNVDGFYNEVNLKNYQVIIINPADCLLYLKSGELDFENFNLLILEDCHENEDHSLMLDIFKNYYHSDGHKPKVLALGGPLHSANCAPQSLKAILEILEGNVDCKAETASDIVTVLRYCSEPYEFILQCAPPNRDELTKYLEEIVNSRKAFLEDHRYDPSEIYSDDFSEELKGIPDPTLEPLELLNNYLEVLYDMGPWCADRVAHSLWTKLEKQKIKTPYERHFLLLSFISTTLTALHTFTQDHLQKIPDDLERIKKYSTPKVIRLLEVLKLFKPEDNNLKKTTFTKLSNDIESLDFRKLEASLKAAYQTVENLENSTTKEIVENLETIIQGRLERSIALNAGNTKHGRTSIENNTRPRKNGNLRQKKRIYNSGRRFNRENGDTDSLCGIIFCNKKSTAIVIFDLLCVASRNDPDLQYLSVQYTVDRTADPITEPKEAEIEHRRQEEVLKRFRTHECNCLIGTSVLEEGIDLPKCNLVIRWDPPKTYRSYVQCKGRARASQAYHVILVSPMQNPKILTSANEVLSNNGHRYICSFERNYISKCPKNDLLIVNDDNQKELISNDFNENDKIKARKLYKDNEINSSTQFVDNGHNQTMESSCNLNMESSNANQNYSCDTSLVKETSMEIGANNHSYEDLTQKDDINKVSNGNFDNIGNGEDPSSPKCEEYKDHNLELNNEHLNKPSSPCKLNEFEQSKEEIFKSWDHFEEMENSTNEMVDRLAQYREIEKMLLGKCANTEPNEFEHQKADKYTSCVLPYKPLPNVLTGATVDLGSSIALVNKYCAKLPSDTFTKLTPLFRCAKTVRSGVDLYQYTIRLPINSPMKYDIVGLPMPTKILARRMSALQVCRELHKCAELDDNLQPIGKEGFKAYEPDWEDFELEKIDEQIVNENSEPRPGTTKRRQYYYKRIASEFSNCRPIAGANSYLYFINLTLQCPIPEEQNTRGRKIYPPEDSKQGFGILTLKKIPKVSSFPIFTRSGEVKVSIQLSKDPIILTEKQINLINVFLNYTFTNVLRLQKFLMLFDPQATENCVFIVPTKKTHNDIVIDWDFLETINENCDKMPNAIPDEVRDAQEFDANKFKDAVVMPWYRNQDQPQYFYVAEICNHLSPESCFPGENYRTFKEYYYLKYQITIQNSKQPLLDVDHTSARLNFLTPRYVNRKGVALPTSSEETKRAKRENLEQKQILVPELCTIHPFPASLWRVAVCLPCILYRINGLLLADDIRKVVSFDLGLGRMEIEDENFEWPMLDFGWSLAEVLKKCTIDKENSSDTTVIDEEITKSMQTPEKSIKSNEKNKAEKSANDILEEADEKLKADSYIEIGTWSNDMANNISDNDSNFEDDDWCGLLPPNVNLCSSSITNIRYGSPTSWDVAGSIKFGHSRSANNYFSDSDESLQTDDGFDLTSRISNDESGPLRIEFKPNNVAEAIETEEEILKRQKQLSIIQATTANERIYQDTKNLEVGYNFSEDNEVFKNRLKASEVEFFESTERLKKDIKNSGMLVKYDQQLILPKKADIGEASASDKCNIKTYAEICPFLTEEKIRDYVTLSYPNVDLDNFKLTINDLENLNRLYVGSNDYEEFIVEGSGNIFDNFNDSCDQKNNDTSIVNITYHKNELLAKNQNPSQVKESKTHKSLEIVDHNSDSTNCGFSFDYQPNLYGHPGPSPSLVLQALTMSNANDGINLERLETIGDSFLKYAITTYLYITYENVHEGKLSHLRSKQVANLNLYRLGRKKVFGECMIATKFEPHDNWLPPCYYVPKELEKALIEAKIPPCHWNLADLPNIKDLSSEKICELVKNKAEKLGLLCDENDMDKMLQHVDSDSEDDSYYMCFIPYNLVTQHSIPDKSVADCVEALIGAYLIECGPRGALLFMAWLGIRVLPVTKEIYDPTKPRVPGSTRPNSNNEKLVYGEWATPKCPLLTFAPNAHAQLELLLDGFHVFEETIGYYFQDRSYLLQAMTHASYSPNRLTDCYQRLEFLGDAVLDYLITRHLYEDPRQHSPGALTDLRSALVNNTIFASLAVRHGFHKYFRHLSPGLNEVIDRFVRIQHENGHLISEECYLMSEEECDDAEDVEVPKALGDVFESVAGAIFLDSNMSLDTVWKVYSNMMKPEIEQFSNSVPKSPIRELLELEPETAKFGKPEKLADGRRVRVTVEVFGKGTFRGIGRNYRIAKCTAAKCALRQLKKPGLISKKPEN